LKPSHRPYGNPLPYRLGKVYIRFCPKSVEMEHKNTQRNKIGIRITLEDDVARKFDIIKARKGVKNNTELIRLLIAEEFARET